jgi:hypothetical protein
MATRHERRKAVRARKNAKAEHLNNRAMRVLQEERTRINLSTHRPKSSPKGLGNRGIYQGVGMFPTKGYGSGMFKRDDTSMSDGQLRHWLSGINKRVDKTR